MPLSPSPLFPPFYAHSRRPKHKQTTSVDPLSPVISPPMAPAVADRIELAKLCSSKDWSKAIRILDSLLAQSCAIQDLCNRAFCFSQLELHKHVVKDCDKALQLDPMLLQAYILKGHAFSALGRKEEAFLVWEKGYEHAVCQSADLKQLMELEELMRIAKQNDSVYCQNSDEGSSFPASESVVSTESSDASQNHGKSNGRITAPSCSTQQVESQINGLSLNVKVENSFGSLSNTKLENRPLESNGIHKKKKSVGKSALNNVEESSSEMIDSSDLCSEPLSLSEIHNELKDEANRSKKLCVSRVSKNKSINVDFRLSRGIAQVNEGEYAHAISIFDKILQEEPDYPEALIGRGTAYAFQRELHAAIADFTKAIESNPLAGEAWKRRGQARAALGESAKAIADLTKALDFEPNSPDILHERGIVNFKFKDYKAAVEDLSACIEVDDQNKSALTYLGLALSSLGEYKRAEEAHTKAIQIDQNFLEAWTHLTQFYQDMENSEKALRCIHDILKIDESFAKAYHLHGVLLHGMGEHRNAIKELSTGLSIDSSNIECLYLRASCYHAIGEFKEAVKDYDAALDLELDSMEKFVLQCLAFYQKEIALYTASKFNTEFSWFDLDGDIDPLFKEYWCKKLHPKNVCEKVYRQPPLRDSMRKGKLKKQEFTLTKQKAALLQAADSIGKKIQYHCPGFMPNKRQYRMAGLAALEIAQKVVRVWRSLQTEWKNSNKGSLKHGKKVRRKEKHIHTSQNRGGAGCSTSSFFESLTINNAAEEKQFGRPSLPWHGLYSMAVKWRQISEPCDPVVWINKLSEEFNSGFGSQTPLVLGQAKVVRYFPKFDRAFSVAKALMMDNKYARDKKDNLIYLNEDGKLQEILNAESCSDLYKAVGQDFWLTTWCHSMAVEGKQLEGTRISLEKTDPTGYDFAVKTPCTPSRWDDFEMEMTSAWEALCDAYCGENYGSTDFDVLENVREAILRMTYYWYNFMALSRGTAVIGLVVLLGLLLAANMEFTGSIPEGIQVDWDAVLERDPNSFISCVKSWLYPSLKMSTSWKGYPDVASTLETTGLVVAALSTYSD
ncbi:suppressor of RPS4-RLD 1-like [Salvia splendens]|uniref:suppressor of RPS4-RLD 1-like n=1 Tax=Salvia splendens TaxID=180675 RepID=UPI001C2569AA|nr:suppressor of RPS4-RLD 1-like [Salvia splendens]